MINRLYAFSPCRAIGVTLKVFLISTILYPVRTDKPKRKHMKTKVATTILAIAGLGMTNAATVIGDGVGVADGTGGADGWSGISVLESAVIDSTTEGGGQLQATSVSIQAQRVGTNHFIPLLVNSANEIAWIGPQLTPTVAGLNTFAITGAEPIDASGGDLRLGVWQWNEGVNNSNGGTITFGNGGGGMFQMDVDGTQGASAVSLGMAVTSGHASGAGGRDYNVDLTVAPIPEPTVFPLIALSGLGLLLRRRRS